MLRLLGHIVEFMWVIDHVKEFLVVVFRPQNVLEIFAYQSSALWNASLVAHAWVLVVEFLSPSLLGLGFEVEIGYITSLHAWIWWKSRRPQNRRGQVNVEGKGVLVHTARFGTHARVADNEWNANALFVGEPLARQAVFTVVQSIVCKPTKTNRENW
jgi:hypothetical protein